MCGIWAWILANTNQKLPSEEEILEKGVRGISKRGPEGHRILQAGNATFAFTRLAINGLNDAGMQPFHLQELRNASGATSETLWGLSRDEGSTQANGITWMCNGEIYNAHRLNIPMPSGSDCEVMGALYERCERDPVMFCRALDGVFAFVLYDGHNYVVGRDPYGVRPLYYMQKKEVSYLLGDLDCPVTIDQGIIFASERKALEPFANEHSVIEEFPPGQVWTIQGKQNDFFNRRVKKEVYHTVPWIKMADSSDWNTTLRLSLEAAVKKRVELSERPIAALLSGGLDSSLIAALVQEELKLSGKPPLKTFSIGMPGSTDLKYARMVADHIGSDHTEILTTADEMFSYIPEVIRDIESYDITTVRASVGNWLVSKRIRETTDCKVVFNGDGSDEILGGYLYFYRAPSDEAFERESERLLAEISKYDVLRSDRSISSHGLEPRTPFLDKQFVQVARSLPTDLRRPTKNLCEKWCLRTAFQDTCLLPYEVLWRKKEAFSDGVSSQEKSWYQEVQERIEQQRLVPFDWEQKAKQWCDPIPKTKEAFYYRTLYESMYKHTATYWPFWMPKWSGETTDPSARTLSLY
jgi:asparagine synthase (glutamine-hydrolysing)